ncbi:MAG: ferrous iron transport protein B [Phycisphaerae bacterium]
MSEHRLTIALAGNPNSGKTTLFNALTGSRRHVGNYPGVTVEIAEGLARTQEGSARVIDLPGTYSLTAYSQEEVVARDFVMERDVDVVVDVVDASNLERNLYLAVQFIELGVPLVLALNMSDIAESHGLDIDERMLSELLGVPAVKTVAPKGEGISELLEAARVAAADGHAAVNRQRHPHYGYEVEPHVEQLADAVARRCGREAHRRWFAVKLLEGDDRTHRRLRELCGEGAEELFAQADKLRRHVETVCGDSAEVVLADRRYGYIAGACREAVSRRAAGRLAITDKLDTVLTNRYVGLPIFAVLMFVVFQIVFWLGNPAVEVLETGRSALAAGARETLTDIGAGELLTGLIADGIIEGVGAVLTFVPLILLLFLAIAVLEDSGYMPRAAYVLDRLMHRIGLHGKSFIPMLIGFGCTVPAVMATRVLESRRDRLVTILVLPLMSCGARLPVYLLIIGAFFKPEQTFELFGFIPITNQGLLLFVIYVIGVVLAIVCVKVLRRTLFRGEVTPFLMELPPYRMPTARGLVVHMAEPTWHYLKKAGTIILAIVIVLWALKTWPQLPESTESQYQNRIAAVEANEEIPDEHRGERLDEIKAELRKAELEHSAIGRVGKGIEPVLRPAGFDWRVSTALVGSMAAKEVFVGQMGVIYAVADADEESESLREKLSAEYTPVQGFAMMLFVLISSPCIATVAVTIRESGSWKWAAMQWGYLTVLAWVVTTAFYQTAMLFT